MGKLGIGKRIFIASFSNQGLNTRSYTEAEVIMVDDMISKIMWCSHFLKCNVAGKKGFRLLVNVTTTYGNYYFTRDLVDQVEVAIEYLGEKDMIVDF